MPMSNPRVLPLIAMVLGSASCGLATHDHVSLTYLPTPWAAEDPGCLYTYGGTYNAGDHPDEVVSWLAEESTPTSVQLLVTHEDPDRAAVLAAAFPDPITLTWADLSEFPVLRYESTYVCDVDAPSVLYRFGDIAASGPPEVLRATVGIVTDLGESDPWSSVHMAWQPTDAVDAAYPAGHDPAWVDDVILDDFQQLSLEDRFVPVQTGTQVRTWAVSSHRHVMLSSGHEWLRAQTEDPVDVEVTWP